MLRESDKQWLRDIYPALTPSGNGVAGTIEFVASYNNQSNTFLILGDGITGQAGAVALSCTFEIRVEERNDKSISQLPALYVQGVDPTADRHFNQREKSACLCSPFDEAEFLQPEFQFKPFFEQLVIPFLYGQAFYSSKGHWPWTEYAHGATGILEAYLQLSDQNRAGECLQRLVQDREWPRIHLALRQKPYVKGHTPCFCSKRDQIRRCHADALKGVLRLQQDLKELGIPIP
jgi:hypothetical protein